MAGGCSLVPTQRSAALPLGLFLPLARMSDAAWDLGTSFRVDVCFRVSRAYTWEWNCWVTGSPLNYVRSGQSVFQSSRTALHSLQRRRRVPLFWASWSSLLITRSCGSSQSGGRAVVAHGGLMCR